MLFHSSGGRYRDLDDAHLAIYGHVGNIVEAMTAKTDLTFLWIELVDALRTHNEIEELLISRYQHSQLAPDHRAVHRYFIREVLAIQQELSNEERIDHFFHQLRCHTAGPLEQDLFQRMLAAPSETP